MLKIPSRLFKILWVNVALLTACPEQVAQEFDAVLTIQNRKPSRIVDEITDPKERKALLALYGEGKARRRAELAESFVATYSRSWFLAQAHELAARAYIDLGDYQRALEHARISLKLLPENPLLLVLVANVQALHGLTAEAKESAGAALEYMDRFARPSAIPERKWPALERQLRASSYFAIARATVSEALALQPGATRTELLEHAEKLLSTAQALNPEDSETACLRGLSFWSLGRLEEAGRSFAAAYRLGGARAQATEYLRKIYQTSNRDPRTTFEAFLKREAAESRGPRDPVPSAPQPHQVLLYAGSEQCRKCHLRQHEAWEKTGMARMLRPYRSEDVIGDFEQKNEFYAGDEIRLRGDQVEVVPGKDRFLFARMLIDRGRHYFEIRQSSGRWTRYPVDYVIGHKWQQAYATQLANGQIHVFPVQYNALHKRWLNFWKLIDPPESERADTRSWETLSPATSYHANCAVCHTSQLKNRKGRGFEADNVEFQEPGINCEACHGPSARHAAAMAEGKPSEKESLDPPVDFGKISSQDYVGICAQCHMQSAVREPGPRGELNYSGEQGTFFKRNKSRPLAEFSRKAFYKDGRLRETTFIVEALMRSACFKKGNAHCGHCHHPHGKDSSTGQASLKFAHQPDQMCLQCHTAYATKIEAHTRHPAQSEGSRCVSCHMPRIMHSLLFKARTHEIDNVPDTEMTERFGQEESPNACLICHRDKDTRWLRQQPGTNRTSLRRE